MNVHQHWKLETTLFTSAKVDSDSLVKRKKGKERQIVTI